MEAIMKDTYISEAVKYIGADDTTLDLFESQYQIPNGVSYKLRLWIPLMSGKQMSGLQILRMC